MKCGVGGDAFVVLHEAGSGETVAFNGSGVAAARCNAGILREPWSHEDAAGGRARRLGAGRRERLRSDLEALLHPALGGAVGARISLAADGVAITAT